MIGTSLTFNDQPVPDFKELVDYIVNHYKEPVELESFQKTWHENMKLTEEEVEAMAWNIIRWNVLSPHYSEIELQRLKEIKDRSDSRPALHCCCFASLKSDIGGVEIHHDSNTNDIAIKWQYDED